MSVTSPYKGVPGPQTHVKFCQLLTIYRPDPAQRRYTCSILRASTLLSFKTFRYWAIGRLESVWSSDLIGLTIHLPNATEAVILGRNYGVPSILKRAFYELLRTGGFSLEEVQLSGDAKNPIECDTKPNDILLAPQDLRRLVLTREQLTLAWVLAAASAPTLVSECPQALSEKLQQGKEWGGLDGLACPSAAEKRSGWIKVVHDSGMFKKYLYDPICGLDALCEVDWVGQENYCADCFRNRREIWDMQREKLWEKLDSWLAI